MTTTPTRAVALATVLVVASVFGAAGPVMAAGPTTIDADHPLAAQHAIQQYEETGVANGTLSRMDLRLTVADEAGDVGLSEWEHASSLNIYLRVDYDEGLDRTIRLYLPSEYFNPRIKADKRPIAGQHTDRITIDTEPTADGAYTALTITATGQTDAVFAFGHVTGSIFSIKGGFGDLVNNTTGFEPPSLTGGGTQWTYVDSHALTGANATHRIHVNDTDADDITVQYDADPEPGEDNTAYIPVPECEGVGNDPGVCRFQKTGQPHTVYLLSTTQNPPPVRWAAEVGATSAGKSIWDQIASLPERIYEDAASIWPFVLGPGGVA